MAATGAAVFVRWLLNPLLDHAPRFNALYGAVAIAAWFGGWRPALLATILGYLAADFLFVETEPGAPLSWNGPGGPAGLAIYLFTCLIVIGLVSGIRTARRRSEATALEALARGKELEREIAEHRRTEEALRDSEARKAAVLEAALDAIITMDHDGKVVEFNPAAERMFGYRRGDVMGREMAEFIIPPSQRESHRQGLARYLVTGERSILDRRLEMPARRSDGTEFPVELAITRLVKSGPPVFTAHVRDITERRRAEETLQAKEAELELIASRTPLLLTRCSKDQRFVYVNRACAEFLGRRQEEIIGRPIADIVGEEAFAAIAPNIERVLRGEEVEFEMEVPYAHPGRRFMRVSYTPDRDERGQVIGWVASISDVTDRKLAETALREADRRKDEFLATLAHELRNPLAPVRNATEILRLKSPPTPELQWARDVIDRQMQQMTRLIDDLMDVSRITRDRLELRKERVELARVIQGAVETSRALIDGSDHELTVALPADPVYLDADIMRLAQVFSNLINNAAKYSGRGSPISLTAERRGADVLVSVRDEGIGIPQEMLPRIFEMFTQVDRSLERTQGGLGIGLTLVKRLVEMHGGSIEARSGGPGKGSEFIVRLPIPISHPAQESQPMHVEATNAPARCRILVVDDNNDSATSLGMMLSILGYETRTAFDGIAGLEAAAEYRPDVALLDIGMPRMNGYDVARRIREEPWGTDVVLIAVTGWSQAEDKQRTLEAGFDGHLVKPVDPSVLASLLASLAKAHECRTTKREAAMEGLSAMALDRR